MNTNDFIATTTNEILHNINEIMNVLNKINFTDNDGRRDRTDNQ